MSSYDDLLRAIREADRIVAPIREFERLYGRGVLQAAEELRERERLLRVRLPEMSTAYCNAIESFLPALNSLRKFEDRSSATSLLANAHEGLSIQMGKHGDIESIARACAGLGPHWERNISAYERFSDQASAKELALKAHYANVVESALLAQERLICVPWESIGGATTMHAQEFMTISNRFSTLADKYSSLMGSFEEREHFMAAFPPIVSEGPPLELLASANILHSLSRPVQNDGYSEDDCQVESGLEDEFEASVDELLTALDPDLLIMWRGAKEALRSGNPDHRRHVAFSLRELVTHVLHTAAPNDQITSWTSDPSHFHDGKPTRAARVLFICREVNHGPFTKFIDADVKASLEFINLFHRGHELSVSFSEAQMRALVTRTATFLRFLLHTHLTTQ
ncbi:MAG: hypothetical protein ABIK82_12405 [Pseudomonadota bacterium]